MRKFLVTISLAAAGLLPAWGQTNGQSFEDFRAELLKRYDDFRSDVLSNYASFLEGVWVEYESFKGAEKSTEPKPKVQPLFDASTAPKVQPVTIPQPEPVKPDADAVKPATPTQKKVAPDVKRPDDGFPTMGVPTVNVPVSDKAPSTPSPVKSQEPPSQTMIEYRGMEVMVPQASFSIRRSLSDERDFAAQWRELSSDKSIRDVINGLHRSADRLGLNDYLTYDLVSEWVEKMFGGVDESSRLSLVHYIMANLGFDVRIARLTSGAPVLLIPFDQKIYGRRYMNLNDRRYYIFTGPSNPDLNGNRIATCDIPSTLDAGRPLDLRLSPLTLPYKPHHYEVAHNGITLSGEVNANIFPLLHHYPQMPLADYALSTVDPEVRADVVEQLRSQIGEKGDRESADKLLALVQSGFEYATDDEYHGFEKPYFFEEVLFYDKCDCEDRVVFYTYLLWNVLGLESQLLAYPGHESAAVSLDDGVPGDSYKAGGRTFYISDPTFIGAVTGMCMPNFRSISPEIDYTYSRKK